MAMITSYWTLDSLMILITLVLAAYLYMTRKFNYWKKRGVFEIKPLPFFGNLMNTMLFKESSGLVLKNLYNKSKGQRYIGFYVLDKPCLLIRDPEIIKNILVKDFNNFCDRVSYTHSNDLMGRSSLLLLKNPTWKLLRSKLTPMFTSGKLKKMFDLLMKCTVNLDTYLDTLGLDEKEIAMDVKDIFGNLTTDMIGSTAYGLNIDSVNNPECDFRKKGRAIFEFDILRGLELFAIFFYPDISRLFHVNFFGRQNIHFLRNVFWNAINGRIESGEKRNDLIDILIDFRKEYVNQDLGEFQVNGDSLVAQAAIFFTGGFETSSSTTSFLLYEIAVQPEIQNRLREEILDAFIANDGKITYEMILSLPYLDMVFSETLRKYPILTTLDRETLDTYKVADSNLVIEKNMPVFISLLGLHFDPEYFPNPEKYDPERFNKENIHKIPPYVYMPFGEGSRKCIGARLAILQTKLALVKFLRQYEVTPCEKTLIPMVIDPKGASVTSPLGGKIWLNVRKIKTSFN
ncbi:cytochrome P450 6k1-like [Odontomachus brunneus]|uniref:cytochrome P450 6k1-like n=1 Tax=Odontomachus brunneus TaxID=486640 RepID=UPI0013F1D0B5|nr:cytochrome P450 6k1-like [Odontomachus brunneus]XP_032684431.1 cytochrome P450 6k1-like [Odontomachus brunneus]